MNAQASENHILDRFDVVIGIEVHCQLLTTTKLFCPCTTKFGGLPNHNVCPVCLGLPGALPVLNGAAVDYAIRLALAVSGTVNESSKFARKSYFYPDMPKGYQISQYDAPYCSGGRVELPNGQFVDLERIHMEEDAGKIIHGSDSSFIDLNRAGIPLLEIVTKPCIGSATVASEYLRQLRSLVRFLGISDGNMEEGSLRCDVNISLRPRGSSALGVKVEIKNLNSFRNVEKAILYEVVRQADLIDEGKHVKQATMLFDPASGKTAIMRMKEEASDYRYFDDPDLPIVRIDRQRIDLVEAKLPELPRQKRKRWQEMYLLAPDDIEVLLEDTELASYFEECVNSSQARVKPKTICNWLLSEVLRAANEKGGSVMELRIPAFQISRLLDFVESGHISGKQAKVVFREMLASGSEPQNIIADRGMQQQSDSVFIDEVVDAIIASYPEQVSEYRSGKVKVFGFLVGMAMKLGKGKLNPSVLNSALESKLKS